MPPRRQGSNAEAGPSQPAVQAGAIHRHAFLQAVMQRGHLAESEARELYKRICDTRSDANFLGFVAEVNSSISFAQFELRRVKCPVDQTLYLGFVNRAGDEGSKRAGRYRTKDGAPDVRVVNFFRAVLERVAVQEDVPPGQGWIASAEALNLDLTAAAQPATQAADGAGPSTQVETRTPALGKAEREAALGRLVMDGWLAHAPGRRGCYSLGPRSFLELGDYILGLEDLPAAVKEGLMVVLA